MTQNKLKFAFWIIFYLFIFSFLLFNSFHYLDPDLGWHLKVGEQIIAEQAVPQYDNYNYTLEGNKWVNHEWLLDACSFLIFHSWGFIALNILFALLILLILIILHFFVIKKILAKNVNGYFADFTIFFLQLLGLKAMAPHLGVRMQEFALLNLLLLIIIIYSFNKNKKYANLLFLPPLFYFWANIHASFLIGLFILFLWLALKSLELILRRFKIFNFINFNHKFSIKELAVYSAFCLAAGAITLLTPYKLSIVSLVNRINGFNAFHLSHIAEWLPLHYIPIEYSKLIYLAIAGLVIIFFIIKIFAKNKNNDIKNKIELWEFALFIIFFVLSFKSKRHFPLFFIISFPLMIKFLLNNINSSGDLPFQHKTKQFLKLFTRVFLIICMLSMIFVFAWKTNFTTTPFSSEKFCQKYPCKAIDYLKNDPQYYAQRLFSKYGWGGYIIWTWPGKKIFIDGRLPQYPFAGHTLLAEYFEFFKEEKTENKLNEYEIELILLNHPEKIKLNWLDKYIFRLNEEKINENDRYIDDFLRKSENWELLYEDDVSYIYRKIM